MKIIEDNSINLQIKDRIVKVKTITGYSAQLQEYYQRNQNTVYYTVNLPTVFMWLSNVSVNKLTQDKNKSIRG